MSSLNLGSKCLYYPYDCWATSMSDVPGDGGGEGVCGQSTEVLGEAFQSIAESMGHMVDGIRAIELKMELTDQAVRSLAQGLKSQGQRMLKLEQRIFALEESLPYAANELTDAAESKSSSTRGSKGRPKRRKASAVAAPTSYTSVSENRSDTSSASGQASSAPPSASRSSNSPTENGRGASPATERCLERRGEWSTLGRNLLMVAHEGRKEDVSRLLDAGADVNFPNGSKWTPLHRAATKAHPGVVALLLSRGANVHARNSYGFTALHMAACNDFKGRCVCQLIEAGSDVNSKNRSGRTPLHSAAERGNACVVKMLVDAGANRAAKDDEGKTPFDVAKTQYLRRFLTAKTPY